MMRKLFYVAVLCVVFISACEKKVDQPISAPLSDYFPLQVGKYITYDLDSVVYYTNFGQSAVIKSYQIKYEVDAAITDNTGRPAYRVIRYLRKFSNQPWVADNTVMVVSTTTALEYVENNLRFIKLAYPIMQDFSWKGNTYITTTTINSDLKYLDAWEYRYDSINMPAKIGALTVDSTIKVIEVDDQTAIDKTFSEAKYAKGIGLVYRNFLYWNKGNANGTFSDASYGVVLRMTGHN